MAYEIICDTCGRSLDESYFFKDENGNHDHTCWECLRNENRELKAKLEEIRSKVLKFADEYRHLKSSYDDIVSSQASGKLADPEEEGILIATTRPELMSA